jgi:malonyl-CoA O-methyltransferase
MRMTARRKPAIVRAFDRAEDYEAHAHVQRTTALRLAGHIAQLDLPPAPRVLEIGCGTGFLSRELVRLLPGASLVLTDISEAMVGRTRAAIGDAANIRYQAMDGEHPALPGPFDLICSSLAFQWFENLGQSVALLCDVLAPGGYLLFSTLAAGTFAEWRAAHSRAGLAPATRDYPSLLDLGETCPPGTSLRIDAQTVTEQHLKGLNFVRGLKAIGAHTPWQPRAPLPPGALRRVLRAFDESGASATYEIAHVILRKVPEGL